MEKKEHWEKEWEITPVYNQVSFIKYLLDKAREEVLLELLEKKTNYKIEEVGHGYKVTQEYVLVSDIEKELSKLNN